MIERAQDGSPKTAAEIRLQHTALELEIATARCSMQNFRRRSRVISRFRSNSMLSIVASH